MTNSTPVIEFNQTKDDFEHPFHIKIVLTMITLFIIISIIAIDMRLFNFLRRPNRRCLDQIVDIQFSINQTITIFCMILFNIIIWSEVPKNYVSELGCYIGSYAFFFLAPYGNIHSFFIALFRYICIIHPERLTKQNISPQTFGKIIVLVEFILSCFFTILIWWPSSPQNSSFINNCLGNDEVIYFDYDYFIQGGYSRKKKYCQFGNMAMDYTCQGLLLFLTLICSNFLEIPLTSAVLFEMKKSTESVKNLLSKKALAQRKRDDGIVIAINFWQWIAETIFNLISIGLVMSLGANRQLDHFMAMLSVWIGSSVIPSFYFMASADFRRDLENFGLPKAFYFALTKDAYEN